MTIILIKYADIDIPDITGDMPLHFAVLHAHLNTIRLLVEKGADKIIKNNNKKLLLIYSCKKRKN